MSRPPRAIDRIMSGSYPSSAIMVASSRDATPNISQVMISRISDTSTDLSWSVRNRSIRLEEPGGRRVA